jgi:hypothetical protein
VGWSTFDRKCVMSDEDKSRGGRAGEKARPRVKASNERPFDLWLQKQLHAMYDEIASEPLPTDLLNLIDSDAKSDGAKKSAHQEPRNKK